MLKKQNFNQVDLKCQLSCCEVESLIRKKVLSNDGDLLTTETVLVSVLKYLRDEL